MPENKNNHFDISSNNHLMMDIIELLEIAYVSELSERELEFHLQIMKALFKLMQRLLEREQVLEATSEKLKELPTKSKWANIRRTT